MSNRPNPGRNRTRPGWTATPPETAISGRILTPREREAGVDLADIAAAAPSMKACTCETVDMTVVEPTPGTVMEAGQVTAVIVAHDADCPLAP